MKSSVHHYDQYDGGREIDYSDLPHRYIYIYALAKLTKIWVMETEAVYLHSLSCFLTPFNF